MEPITYAPYPTISGRPFYEYTRLPTQTHIRVLILEPGQDQDPLIGYIETTDLNDPSISFEAISYTWSSEVTDHWILVNGQCLAVTKNLAQALRQTRRPHKRRALWADSVCINQKDDKEKGQQVARMGQIYQLSRCTLICLGLEPKHQKDAYNAKTLIEDLGSMIETVFNDPGFSRACDSFPYPGKDDLLVNDSRWKSWNVLVHQPWFQRGWVVQEAALGREAYVLWTGIEIHWGSCIEVQYWLLNRAYSLMTEEARPQTISEILGWTSICQRADRMEVLTGETSNVILGKAFTSTQTLNSARNLELSNPKDRIYAFMALPTSDGALATLHPDYSRDTSYLKVYQSFAIEYLEKTLNLDLLCYVEHDKHNVDDQETVALSQALCPSWVPRWDRGKYVDSMRKEMFDKITNSTMLQASLPNFTIMDGGQVLRVRGIIFDKVKYVSPNSLLNLSDAVEQVVSLWRAITSENANCPGLYRQNLLSAFLETLCRGQFNGEWESWYESEYAFKRLLQSDNQKRPMEVYTQDRDARRISNHICGMSNNRRLALLGRGYLGVVPETTREGDRCAIIFGSCLPFIIRSISGEDNYYKVVGPAWVASKECRDDGRSYRLGSSVDRYDWKDLDLPTQDIFLR